MLTVEIKGLRELNGRFASMLDHELVAIQLEEATAIGTALEDIFRRHAPRGRKVSKDDTAEHFYQTITARASPTVAGFEVQVSTRNPDLRRWLAEGTGLYGPRREVIRPTHGSVLVWRSWPGHGSGPFAARWVRGMKAQPWEEGARLEAAPLATDLGRRIGRRVTMRLAGL